MRHIATKERIIPQVQVENVDMLAFEMRGYVECHKKYFTW
jgi:hypothetical protein